jgi:hypothetical protein
MSVFVHRAFQLRNVDAAGADTLPEPFEQPVPLPDFDDEDTQPSVLLPDADDEFADAPTIPGFTWRADGSLARELDDGALAEGQWDRVLRAVAVAVKRVFASHSIKGLA